MKVNREKFLAAALLLSTATGCDRLGLKGKATASAAPEVASAQIANDPSVNPAPAAEVDPAKPAAAKGAQNTKMKVGVGQAKNVVGPGNEGVMGRGVAVVGPNNEAIAPNKEVVGPGKEAIAPNNEGVIPPAKEVVAPANENAVPANTTVLPHGQVAPGGRARGIR